MKRWKGGPEGEQCRGLPSSLCQLSLIQVGDYCERFPFAWNYDCLLRYVCLSPVYSYIGIEY